MHEKIIVHKQIAITNALLYVLILSLIAIFIIYKLYTDLALFNNGMINFCCGIILFIIPTIIVILWNAFSKEEHVSELVLTDEELIIVHRSGASKTYEKIKQREISSVHAVLEANEEVTKSMKSISIQRFCLTTVEINLFNGNKIIFEEIPFDLTCFCLYGFMLRLIPFAAQLPNFTYEVNGNWELAKKDIEYYTKYGKRLPYSKRVKVVSQRYFS